MTRCMNVLPYLPVPLVKVFLPACLVKNDEAIVWDEIGLVIQLSSFY